MKFDSKRVNIIFFRYPRAGDLHWIRVSAVADAGQIQMAGIEMGVTPSSTSALQPASSLAQYSFLTSVFSLHEFGSKSVLYQKFVWKSGRYFTTSKMFSKISKSNL